MKSFNINIRVSRKLYTDIVVKIKGESLKEAKHNAIKKLDKMFNEDYCEEKVKSFFEKISFKKDDWWEEISFEDWEVLYALGENTKSSTQIIYFE